MADAKPLLTTRSGATITIVRAPVPYKRAVPIDELLSWATDSLPEFIPDDWNSHHFHEHRDVREVDFTEAMADDVFEPLVRTGNGFLPCYIDLKRVELDAICGDTEIIGHRFLFCCRRLVSLDLQPLHRVRSIGDAFLFQCATLTKLDLAPMSMVQSIGRNFLAGCTALAELSLAPLAHVAIIPDGFLAGCSSLVSIDFSAMVKVLQIGGSFLSECAAIPSVDLRPLRRVTFVKADGFLRGCHAAMLLLLDDAQQALCAAIAENGLAKQRALSQMVTGLRDRNAVVEKILLTNQDVTDTAVLEAKSFKRMMDGFQGSLHETLDENERLKTELSAARSTIAALQQESEVLTKSVALSVSHAEEQQAEHAKLICQHDELQHDFAVHKAAAATTEATLQQQLHATADELATLQAAHATLSTEAALLRTDNTQMRYTQRQHVQDHELQSERLFATLNELEATKDQLTASQADVSGLRPQLLAAEQRGDTAQASLKAAQTTIRSLQHVTQELADAQAVIEERTAGRDKAIRQFEHNKHRLDVNWADLEAKTGQLLQTQAALAAANEQVAQLTARLARVDSEYAYAKEDLAQTRSEVETAETYLSEKLKELNLSRAREHAKEEARKALEETALSLHARLFPLRKAATFLRDSLRFGEDVAIQGLDRWQAFNPPTSSPSSAAAAAGEKKSSGHQPSHASVTSFSKTVVPLPADQQGEADDEPLSLFEEIELLLHKKVATAQAIAAGDLDAPASATRRVSNAAGLQYSPKAVRAMDPSESDLD